MAGCLCDQCAALCCRYFALPIDNPDCKKDFDNIRWYLVHENVVIFVEKKQWYIGIMNRCKHLQSDNRCGIYHTRPQICRAYSTENCDYHGGDYHYEHLFTSADDLWNFGVKWLQEERAKALAKKKRARARAKSKSPVKRNKRLPNRSRPTLVLPMSVKNTNAVLSGSIKRNANGRSIALPLL